MARGLSFADAEKMSSGAGGRNYFQLKNDKDEAKVRIMLNKLEDMEDGFMYAVHEVKLGDNRSYVACLREYGDPIDTCPFCADGKKAVPRLYIPLYNIDEDKVQVWERTKGFMSKLTGFCSRYSKPTIVAHQIAIQRNGVKGDMKTTYELYDEDKDDTTLDDLPEIPEILGNYLLDKSAEDMEVYLETGEFPPEDEAEEPPRRRSSSKTSERRGRKSEDEDEEELPFDPDDEEEEERPRRSKTSRAGSGRRTPANRDRF